MKRVCYSPDELRAIRNATNPRQPHRNLLNDLPKDILKGTTRRKRGKAGGVKKRLRSRKSKPYIPSLILGNVQSISNKMDELRANNEYMHGFRTVSMLSFTETWLSEHHSNEHFNIDGFMLLRGDRTFAAGKDGGGGLCLYVNNKYCHPNNVHIKSCTCTPNSEILVVSIRPYYLPREFSHVINVTVYVPHKKNAKQAEIELFNVIQDIEAQSPDAFTVINGDFNHCTFKKSNFYRQVTCHTRGTTILDQCYTNIKDAYVSTKLPNLGSADHNLVLLSPILYKPLVQR